MKSKKEKKKKKKNFSGSKDTKDNFYGLNSVSLRNETMNMEINSTYKLYSTIV